jgi:Proline-rich nuclear receptor coactivator motif
MSTEAPSRGHRHSRSAAMPPASAPSQNPHNPHHLNQQAHTRNSQPETKSNQAGLASQSPTPPRTPRRDYQPASQNSNTNAPDSGSKQKSRNKVRPKNVNTSPAVMKNGHNTPPLTGAQSAGIPSSAKPINTPSTAAYAGPTFHASPAPSALPIPSFYSKSVPDSPGVKGLKSVKEAPEKKENPSPNNLFTPPPANNLFQREESPLDFFFRADREEKARARSASSTQAAGVATGPFQPPMGSPRSSQTPPALPTHSRPRQGHTSKMSANGMFAMELDGEPDAGTPYGPAFSTPYAERIHAARASSQPIQSIEQPFRDPQHSLDRSEALKAYLFSGHPLPSSAETISTKTTPVAHHVPTSSRSHQQTSDHTSSVRNPGLPARSHHNRLSQECSSQVPRPSGRSSGLRQEVTPTKTPTRTPDRHSPYSPSPQLFPNAATSLANGFNDSMASHAASSDPVSTTSLSSNDKAADLRDMEDSLRRILKLDSARSSGVVGGTLPTASASVPNYVGGRPPPMNGMHNGVMGA